MDTNIEKRDARSPHDTSKSRDLEALDLACNTSSKEQGSTKDKVPSAHEEWSTGLLECVRCDEHWRSDLEICVLGTFAPCVLYGMNCEGALEAPPEWKIAFRIYSCLSYVGVCGISGTLLALQLGFMPIIIWLYTSIIMSIPRNIMSLCNTTLGFYQRDLKRKDGDWTENKNAGNPIITHLLCHLCALCQEARELRRRAMAPPLFSSPVLIPPPKQDMARGY